MVAYKRWGAWKFRAIRMPDTRERIVELVWRICGPEPKVPRPGDAGLRGGDLSDVELIRPRRRGLDLCDLRNAKRSQSLLRQLRDDEGRAVPYVRFLQRACKPILWRLRNALGRRLRAGDATRLWPWRPAAGGFEQRRVTVLFSEVVDLPLLAASLDPEELNDVVQRYYQIFARANARFDGCVASLSTDGTLAIFGYPNAHEDDAERALLAARALLNERLLLNPDKRLHMRVGVATGVVGIGAPIVGAKSPEISVVGEAPNLAARLQSVAEPDTILIASGTRRLLGDLFELEPTEPMALKGFDELVIAWRVKRHKGSR